MILSKGPMRLDFCEVPEPSKRSCYSHEKWEPLAEKSECAHLNSLPTKRGSDGPPPIEDRGRPVAMNPTTA